MSKNLANLKAHILPLSRAKHFHDAKNEWVLTGIELNDDWDECPCDKDIKEMCFIRNQTYVGNVCIKKFIEIDTGNLFVGLKRIAKDPCANANKDLIVHAYQLGYIFENEYNFLMQTRLKRNLSLKQSNWKEKINRRILNKTIVRKK